MYYTFSVELSASFFFFFLPLLFPVETALFIRGHPTSLQLTWETAVIQLLWYGCWAFFSLSFLWHG